MPLAAAKAADAAAARAAARALALLAADPALAARTLPWLIPALAAAPASDLARALPPEVWSAEGVATAVRQRADGDLVAALAASFHGVSFHAELSALRIPDLVRFVPLAVAGHAKMALAR